MGRAEYLHADEPSPADRNVVVCACGRRYRGSTRNIAFGGFFRHRDRVNAEATR